MMDNLPPLEVLKESFSQKMNERATLWKNIVGNNNKTRAKMLIILCRQNPINRKMMQRQLKARTGKQYGESILNKYFQELEEQGILTSVTPREMKITNKKPTKIQKEFEQKLQDYVVKGIVKEETTKRGAWQNSTKFYYITEKGKHWAHAAAHGLDPTYKIPKKSQNVVQELD